MARKIALLTNPAEVNERAASTRWPRGPMHYNFAATAELRGFRPLPSTVQLDGVERRLEAMLVAVGNGPSFRGSAHGLAYPDGERVGALPLTVEVAPGSLRVLAPR